ncbi:glycosyltransferase [Patescibacteria group bacterium]|nr:glycosyltransferase [Patescibacteria group bacterium]
MKILMLTPYLPYPLLSGGQIRTYNLLKKLAGKFEVTLFALIKEESERQYIPELEKYCAKVRVFKRSQKPFTFRNIFHTAFSSFPFLVIRNHVPQTIAAVEKELQAEKYDVIHAETFYMMPNIPKTEIPIILVEQTIEYLGYESYADKIKFWPLRQILKLDIAKIRRWEEHYWRSCTKLITMSEEDKRFIDETIHEPKKIEVVSNGVDVKWFTQKERKLPKDLTVLSVGTFNWLPNVEAVKFLVENVWPIVKKKLPTSKLWIVGNAPTPEIFEYQKKDTSITITGGIPDIRDAFTGAHVLVAPVFSGKGTRYKILEAMAAGTPIVATQLAVEGLGVEHGVQVLIGNTAKELADLTVKVLQQPELQKKLAKNGKEFVQTQYDWEFIAQKLDSIYLKMAAQSNVHHD